MLSHHMKLFGINELGAKNRAWHMSALSTSQVLCFKQKECTRMTWDMLFGPHKESHPIFTLILLYFLERH